jgi:hypothetical protein
LFLEQFNAVTRPAPDTLGDVLNHVWPVEERPCFERLTKAINVADRELLEERTMAL